MSIARNFSTQGASISGNAVFDADLTSTSISANTISANNLTANSISLGSFSANSTVINLANSSVISLGGSAPATKSAIFSTGVSSYLKEVPTPGDYVHIANVVHSNTSSNWEEYINTIFTNIPQTYQDIIIEVENLFLVSRAGINSLRFLACFSDDNGATWYGPDSNNNNPRFNYSYYPLSIPWTYNKYFQGTWQINGYRSMLAPTTIVTIGYNDSPFMGPNPASTNVTNITSRTDDAPKGMPIRGPINAIKLVAYYQGYDYYDDVYGYWGYASNYGNMTGTIRLLGR